MDFTHLHVHSHYSLLDGLSKIDELLDTAKQMGMSSIALTDHGVMYGVVEFYQKAKEKGIHPIIGCEAYLASKDMHKKQPDVNNQTCHLTLLVKNQEGYENLVYLNTKAHLEGFYYKPRIDKSFLKKYAKGIIGLSGCLTGEIPKAIISENSGFGSTSSENLKIDVSEKLALEYQKIFGKGNFYLELQHHPGIPQQKIVNQALIKIANKHDIPLVATNDVHYTNPEDSEAQDVLTCISSGKVVSDQNRLNMRADDFSLRSPKQMQEAFKDTPEAIENTKKIAEKCNFDFELHKLKLPYFEVPAGETPYSYLKKMCEKGIKERFGENPGQESGLSLSEIKERLNHELDIIKRTGFSSYFLIVQDFVNWAKSQNIVVGPGRGSAAGSLVAYLLNITDIQPIKYNLLFGRFLNPERNEMPDIDLDFADDRREEVINYVSNKYGSDRVAQIITFGTMAARAAVRDVGRVLGYSYNFCDQIAKLIPFGFTLKEALEQSVELNNRYDSEGDVRRLIDMSMKLEGVARHASTHAAGVVITKDRIDKLVPLQYPSQSESTIVTQYEMHAIEDLGLLKMDFLGLRTLTVIQNTLSQVQANTGKEIKPSDIPLDDEKTFQLFRKGNTTGVFQFESSGFKKYLKELVPTKFEDLIAMVALYRPGPMQFIPEFVARKHGEREIEYLHPKLEPILKNTYGICIYQEQLMQIAQDLAGFSLSEADVLRKAVGKKIKELLDEQKEKLIKGMVQKGIKKEVAEQIWKTVEPFARYGFNRAHSTSYATVGYWTAYLKAHYPVEFMVALMTSEQANIEKIAFLVEECRQMNLEVLPPTVNQSDKNFTKGGKTTIHFGLNATKNVGHNIVESIVEERKANGKFKNITDFIERVHSKDLNKKSLESLIKAGALDEFGERNQLLASLEEMLNLSKNTQKAKQSGQISLFNSSQMKSSFKLKEVEPAGKKEYLGWEKELLGLYISEHPIHEYKDKLPPTVNYCCHLSQKRDGAPVQIAGIVNKVKKVNTRNGHNMLFVEIEDITDKVEAIVFPNILERTSEAWQEDQVAIIEGRLSRKDNSNENKGSFATNNGITPAEEQKQEQGFPEENLKIIANNIRLIE